MRTLTRRAIRVRGTVQGEPYPFASAPDAEGALELDLRPAVREIARALRAVAAHRLSREGWA